MGRAVNYEFIRIKDVISEENLLVTFANIREITIDTVTNKVLQVKTRYTHSEEHKLDNLPVEIQNLQETIRKLDRREFDALVKLHENNTKEFLYYEPNKLFM